MSTVEANPEVAGDPVPERNDLELTAARDARVGALAVRRLLPLRLRRSVGAWCFVDHYGPADVDGSAGMNVPPHPHIGLQTVTWLLRGNVLHRDSLGSEQLIRPGQLNLMTSGRGIAHAEESPVPHLPVLHGVQLWVALPDASRHVRPAFEHHPALPAAGLGGFDITVFLGELAGTGAVSPATTFSPVVGAEVTAAGRAASCILPLRPDFEYAIFVAAGQGGVEGIRMDPGRLLYLPPGRSRSASGCSCGGTSWPARRKRSPRPRRAGGRASSAPWAATRASRWPRRRWTPPGSARRAEARAGRRARARPAGFPAGPPRQLTRHQVPGSPATQASSRSAVPDRVASPGSARHRPATGLTTC
jgi:redox-sensitive bicupin YhaK (pirin superfamily)